MVLSNADLITYTRAAVNAMLNLRVPSDPIDIHAQMTAEDDSVAWVLASVQEALTRGAQKARFFITGSSGLASPNQWLYKVNQDMTDMNAANHIYIPKPRGPRFVAIANNYLHTPNVN